MMYELKICVIFIISFLFLDRVMNFSSFIDLFLCYLDWDYFVMVGFDRIVFVIYG